MLHIITGTMCGGKSKTLIEYADKFKDKKVKIFYPACINKSEGYVYSRDKDRKIKATKIYELNDLYNHLNNCEIILLDEYTFYCSSNQIDDFMKFLEHCDKLDIDIYLFGLSLDYLSNSFEITSRVLPYADSIMVLNAVCDKCGAKASRQLRIVDGEIDVDDKYGVLLVESDNVRYMPLCRKCYRELTGLSAIK